MKIEVGSTWVNKNDLDNTVTVDTVGAFAVTGHSDKDGLYMANINDFLHYFKPLPDSQHEPLSELSEQEFENIIDEAFEEGYAQAYSELQTKTERERALQEKAWDEGYDQAIDDLIEAGVIGEEEYPDEGFSDECYSEYEFGDVEDDEEEYCFSKELDRILNGEFNLNNKSTRNNKEDLVNNPSHYNSDPSGVKCIEITRHRNNNIGNVIKYVWRNGLKDGNSDIQDLEKAAWYLNDEIQRLKGLENGLE